MAMFVGKAWASATQERAEGKIKVAGCGYSNGQVIRAFGHEDAQISSKPPSARPMNIAGDIAIDV
jgi:hypothetical protein